MAKFINSSGYKEITLKSDTEPAIIALEIGWLRIATQRSRWRTRSRETSFETDWSKRGHVVARCHQNHQVPCGDLHTRRTPRRLSDVAVVGGTREEHLVQVPERSRRSDTIERLHGKKPTQEFVPFGEEVLARPISSEPLNRMTRRCKFGVWLGVRNNSTQCVVETTDSVFRAREVRRIEHQDRWDKETINNVIGVPWRMVDGK